ncbi:MULTISPECIES: cytidylyltransferase domain-containing protein [Flavobacterium]|jgi:N-acylneuraminate cytidylyltransferase|uniref:Acylneuraminate cytidylyltransferase n=1 Tax=Flavobacterium tructae TaxID=1114873 RepID=A0A1S1J4E2_9FLAO|nr:MULTISPECIES: acylneuraminate cytidylyltransferase family protein [Flavobacterium]OHT44608.1 acylneuraminate cytidylyltransferase [Flavobacterium tructae]OXB19254.1 acylneuraminate cytidylyltransferase [Flavobacterium tructae]
MKTIAIIPARGGSKRLPQKNIKLLGGIPLLAHSIMYAKANSAIIEEIYVSTDDESIKEIALKYGAKVIDRPADISGDHEATASALKHVLQNIDHEVENVVLLQPTNPVRPESLLKETFEIYQKEDSDSLFTVSRNYKKFGKITDQKFVPYNYKIGQRSQDMEPLYFENGLLYITKASLIFEDIIISEDAFPFKIDHIFANVDIDTQEDFDFAEFLYHKYIKP